MKFHFVKDLYTFTSGPDTRKQVEDFGGKISCRSITVKGKAEITPMVERRSEVEKCAYVKGLLIKRNAAKGKTSDLLRSGDPFWNLTLTIGVFPGTDVHLKGEKFWRGFLKVQKPNHLHWLSELDSVVSDGPEDIELQVSLQVLESGQPKASVAGEISTNDMAFKKYSPLTAAEDVEVLFPTNSFEFWEASENVHTRVTVTVSFPDYFLPGSLKALAVNPSRKILEEEVLSDVTIVCGDGTKIRANRCFLAARSPVFNAMFRSDMRESRESVVEIPEMDADSVRAFLKYLYNKDTSAGCGVQLAFELFKAGHKYDVDCLEHKMRGKILLVGDKNIDMNFAVRLFMFSWNLAPAEEELKMKAVRVLKLHADQLCESPEMQELHQTNAKAAMELLQCAFKCD